MADDKNKDPVAGDDKDKNQEQESKSPKTKKLVHVAAETFVWAKTPEKNKKAKRIEFKVGDDVVKKGFDKDLIEDYTERGLIKEDYV